MPLDLPRNVFTESHFTLSSPKSILQRPVCLEPFKADHLCQVRILPPHIQTIFPYETWAARLHAVLWMLWKRPHARRLPSNEGTSFRWHCHIRCSSAKILHARWKDYWTAS